MYKTPKGTVDYYNESADKLEYMLDRVRRIFEKNGGKYLDTPVFERKDVVMGKYGSEAETKLIYEIEDNGGEKLVLRYDLTIPFIRFIKEKSIKKYKRYSIGKVYRRDNPNVMQGRFREFYQCDFDILGESNTNMVSEGVILNMVNQIMLEFGISDYKIIINDTENLKQVYTMLFQNADADADAGAVAGAEDCDFSNTSSSNTIIDLTKFKSVCSTIDKLDKLTFNEIKEELSCKGLTSEQILKLETYLKENKIYNKAANSRLNALYTIAEIWGFRDKIEYRLSLARGLDYYNGIIFEVKVCSASTSSSTSNTSLNTSVMAGGRYDNLLPDTSLIGFSVGITRMMSLIDSATYKKESVKKQYYVTSIGNIDLSTRLKVVKWCDNNLLGEKDVLTFSFSDKEKKFGKVLEEQLKAGTTDLIIIAEEELKNNKIIHKDLVNNSQTLISPSF